MRHVGGLVAALTVLLATDTAWAQAVAPAPGSAETVSEKVAPGEDVPKTDMSGRSGTLSDKLSTTNGVIRPAEEVDPSIETPAPATGSMPVIRPPGSPGGSTDVQPK